MNPQNHLSNQLFPAFSRKRVDNAGKEAFSYSWDIQAITFKDLAALDGLSPAKVSRLFHFKPFVEPDKA